VFIGAVIGVAKNNHIQVDFFYRFSPAAWHAGCLC
jgi:TRAP-type C4-dicarboxylate transport system permease small subunit